MTKASSCTKSDTRADKRRRTLLRGKIVHTNGTFTQDCSIRNLSRSGTQIRVPNVQNMPHKIYLIDIPNAMIYSADVVWRRAPEFGLRFTASHPAMEVPSRLSYLRNLWLDCAQR